jgi:hypothetical protein
MTFVIFLGMNGKSIKVLNCALMVVLGMLILQACGQPNYWEKTLAGPFTGSPYASDLSSPSDSSLKLGSSYFLETHWESTNTDPIVCLRPQQGKCVWARALVVPQPNDGRVSRITQLTLKSCQKADDGFKVLFLCDWTGGGKERGLIYLDKNYAFREFKLGW